MQRGQIIKFGRYVYKINEISTQPYLNENKIGENTEIDGDQENASRFKTEGLRTLEDQQIENRNLKDAGSDADKKQREIEISQIKNEVNKDAAWRIWLSEEQEDSNDPLISPCKWSGTMKYIHLKWLTEWLESKKISKDGVHFRSYLWETIFCELWKEEFKSVVYSNGKRISLLGYDVPKNGHYLVLEAINTEEIMRKKIKIIHIVDFKSLSNIILGRGNDAHVKISDISISRNHAHLKIINNNEIWLEDYQSKFGSLLIQNDPVEITTNQNKIILQCGRTLVTVTWQIPGSCWWFKPSSMIQGFSLINYLDDYPESIKEMMLPRRALLEKFNNSYEAKNDLIDWTENITNSNLLDSHKVTKSTKDKEEPKKKIDPISRNNEQRNSGRRVEEQKIIEQTKNRNINGPTPSKFWLLYYRWYKYAFTSKRFNQSEPYHCEGGLSARRRSWQGYKYR